MGYVSEGGHMSAHDWITALGGFITGACSFGLLIAWVLDSDDYVDQDEIVISQSSIRAAMEKEGRRKV